VRDVTECSRSCWVAAHLYQDSVVECRLVEEAMMRLAPKFKYIKFVKIRSTQAIENWPEKNLPTVFFYHGGELKTQLITLTSVGGKKMTADGKTFVTHLLSPLHYFRNQLLSCSNARSKIALAQNI
jgi:Phosducin